MYTTEEISAQHSLLTRAEPLEEYFSQKGIWILIVGAKWLRPYCSLQALFQRCIILMAGKGLFPLFSISGVSCCSLLRLTCS